MFLLSVLYSVVAIVRTANSDLQCFVQAFVLIDQRKMIARESEQ